jgi:hypothetical protein
MLSAMSNTRKKFRQRRKFGKKAGKREPGVPQVRNKHRYMQKSARLSYKDTTFFRRYASAFPVFSIFFLARFPRISYFTMKVRLLSKKVVPLQHVLIFNGEEINVKRINVLLMWQKKNYL